MKEYYDNDRYKTTYTVDKKAHPDTEEVTFLGRNVKLGDLRQVYSKFDERKYKMISFYDDIFQYTTLGLYEIVCEKYGLDLPIPVKEFFSRTEVSGIDFVYNHLRKVRPSIDIKRSDIETIEEDEYSAILMRSPLSKNFDALFKMRQVLDSHMIVFKHKFNGYKEFLKTISDKFDTGYTSFEPVFLHGLEEKSLYAQLPDTKREYFDIVICNDARSLVDFLLSKGIEETMIMTSLNHCGITPEDQYLYEEILEGVGPNNSRFYYLREDI